MKKIFNKTILVVAIIIVATTTFACNTHKTIPDAELEKIITESIIRQSIIDNHPHKNRAEHKRFDTLETHKDILDKYGYTILDFTHTAKAMARRKSNPMEAILGRVAQNIEKQATVAENKYLWHKKFEQMARDFYTDTIYNSTQRIGRDFRSFRAQVDSLEAGSYTVQVEYQSMVSYKYPQKSLRFFNTTDGRKSSESVIWLTRNDKPRTSDSKFTLTTPADSLIIFVQQARFNHKDSREMRELQRTDTSYIKQIKVIYTPPVEVVTKDFYDRMYLDGFVHHSLKKHNDRILQKHWEKPNSAVLALPQLVLDPTKITQKDEKNIGHLGVGTHRPATT